MDAYPTPPVGVSPDTGEDITRWIHAIVDQRVNEHIGIINEGLTSIKLAMESGREQATATCVQAIQDEFVDFKTNLNEHDQADWWKSPLDIEGK